MAHRVGLTLDTRHFIRDWVSILYGIGFQFYKGLDYWIEVI